MTDNVISLDEHRTRTISAAQWEALAYLANRGSILVSAAHEHPHELMRTLLGSCHATNLCHTDAAGQVVTLTPRGRSALALRLRTLVLEADEHDRLRHMLSRPASRRQPQDDRLAKSRLVRMSGSEWTWYTELGRLVAHLAEIGS